MLVLKHHGNSNKKSNRSICCRALESNNPLATISWAAFCQVSTTWTRGDWWNGAWSKWRRRKWQCKKSARCCHFKDFNEQFAPIFFGGQYWEVKIEEIWSSFSCFSFGILNYRWILIAFRMWDAEDRRNCETKKSSGSIEASEAKSGEFSPRLKVPNQRKRCFGWWENLQKHPPQKKGFPKDKRHGFMLTQ